MLHPEVWGGTGSQGRERPMVSWWTRPSGVGPCQEAEEVELWETQAGPDCQAFALYPGPRQSHEPLDLLVVSLAQENAHVGTGQAIETGKLRTGVEPTGSHCGGAGGQESLNWAGPGTPWSETTQ